MVPSHTIVVILIDVIYRFRSFPCWITVYNQFYTLVLVFCLFHRYVITPYIEYPQLLGLLLKLLNGELAWSTRHEVLKVAI